MVGLVKCGLGIPRFLMTSSATPEADVVDGRYRLIRRIASGGMGEVHECEDIGGSVRRAIKFLSGDAAGRKAEDLARRFVQEAEAAAAIKSPHVVKVLASGTEPSGRRYLVMELLQGQDLHTFLNGKKRLEPQAAARIALQVAKGLAAAHAGGVVHRDIKPANLYLHEEDGENGRSRRVVKILDFGIAKVRIENHYAGPHEITRTENLIGTPGYMSPEQATPKDADPRMDVWSLGVVLFRMLSGGTPFEGTPSQLLITRVLRDPLPRLHERARWVPTELALITHRAMSHDLSLRFPNASAMAASLAAFLRSSDVEIGALEEVTAKRRQDRPKEAKIDRRMLEPRDYSRPRARTGTVSRVGLVALALGLVGDSGAHVATHVPDFRDPSREPPPPPPPSAPTPMVSQAPPLPPAVLLFRLAVPSGVDVTVDGEPKTVSSGAVEIAGPPGSRHDVVLRRGAKSQSLTVTTTETGLEPPRAAWKQPAASAPQPRAPGIHDNPKAFE